MEPLIVTTPDALKALVAEAVADAFAEHERGERTEPALVSGNELAERLGVSRTTVHRLRKEGAPCVRLGDSYKYAPAKVLAWLESRPLN